MAEEKNMKMIKYLERYELSGVFSSQDKLLGIKDAYYLEHFGADDEFKYVVTNFNLDPVLVLFGIKKIQIITMKLYNNYLTSLISLIFGSLKLILSQILRYFDYGLMFYFIFASILPLVWICAPLVDCLSVLPSGFYDCVLLINNRGNPDN